MNISNLILLGVIVVLFMYMLWRERSHKDELLELLGIRPRKISTVVEPYKLYADPQPLSTLQPSPTPAAPVQPPSAAAFVQPILAPAPVAQQQ